MGSWKKVIVSGSDAVLNNITSSGNVSSSAASTASFGTYIGDGSQLTNIDTGSTPTLDAVTTVGSTTANGITVGNLTSSGDISLPANPSTINFTNGAGIRGRYNGSYPGVQFYSGNTSNSKIWFWKGTAGSLSAPTVSFNGGTLESISTLKSSGNNPLIIQGGNPSNDVNDGIRFQTADAGNVFKTRFEIESDGATSDAYFTNITGLGINKTANFLAELDVSGDIYASGDITASNAILADLTVTGTASFQHTEDLDIADRFIKLASGSDASGVGGIAVQQTSATDAQAFGWDNATGRWGITGSFDASQNTFSPSAYMTVTVNGTDNNPDNVDSVYHKIGNMYIDTDAGIEGVWIYI